MTVTSLSLEMRKRSVTSLNLAKKRKRTEMRMVRESSWCPQRKEKRKRVMAKKPFCSLKRKRIERKEKNELLQDSSWGPERKRKRRRRKRKRKATPPCIHSFHFQYYVPAFYWSPERRKE